MGSKSIFITTNTGQILTTNISNGKTISSYKISRNKISEPYVNNKKLYVIKDDEIIRLD